MSDTRVNLSIHGVDATRWIAANEQNRRHAEACRLLGEADLLQRWILRDRRRELPDRVIFSRRLEDGRYLVAEQGGKESVTLDRPEEYFGAALHEPDPDVVYDFGPAAGKKHGMRFQLWCGSIERYEPLSETAREQRAETRKRRAKEREDQKWREAHPLFAEVAGRESA